MSTPLLADDLPSRNPDLLDRVREMILLPLADAFAAANAVVIGVSRDAVKKLDRFKAKHDLKVILGSDEDGVVCEAYGVWVMKKLYGREYMGVERATFLIDGAGLVRRVWRNVKVKGHAEQVLEAAQSL